jgi:hypothetical protein
MVRLIGVCVIVFMAAALVMAASGYSLDAQTGSVYRPDAEANARLIDARTKAETEQLEYELTLRKLNTEAELNAKRSWTSAHQAVMLAVEDAKADADVRIAGAKASAVESILKAATIFFIAVMSVVFVAGAGVAVSYARYVWNKTKRIVYILKPNSILISPGGKMYYHPLLKCWQRIEPGQPMPDELMMAIEAWKIRKEEQALTR